MKVSLSLLKKYLPETDLVDINQLADSLTMVGLETDSVYDRFDYLKTVIAGKVLSVEKHPDADKLKICKIDIPNQKNLSLVCGAPNIKTDMIVPVALPGTVLANGISIKESVIRKVLSQGMICSEQELGIGEDAAGIMVLDPSVPAGSNLKDILDISDYVIEIDLTPNRPDCLGIIGVAREIAGFRKSRLQLPDCSITDSENTACNMTSVKIEDTDLCLRYSARLLVDVKVGPSPFWLQDHLLSAGIRPINNIVDITNFVMIETCQPLHAFDFDLLVQNRIIVRRANQGETFVTLDNKKRKLDDQMLMICDGQKPVGIAGVMGGFNSEINQSTTRVLIESAYFDPSNIRKTSKKLGLSTDASFRFERGTDLSGTVKALNRACMLTEQIDAGKMLPGLIDEFPNPQPKTEISVDMDRLNRVLDLNLSIEQIKSILSSIGFEVKSKNRDILVTAPFFRVDIKRPQDIMEEAARIWGYDKIPTKLPNAPVDTSSKKTETDFIKKIVNILSGFGFNQVINYSFIHPKSCDYLKIPDNDYRKKTISILNPITEEQSVMRTSLIPGLLETTARNISKQVSDIKIFEYGRVFFAENTKTEKHTLAGLQTGAALRESWFTKAVQTDYYDIKGIAEGLFDSLSLPNMIFTQMPEDQCIYTVYGSTARIIDSQNKTIGLAGEVTPGVLKNYDLKQKVFIFEIDLEQLQSISAQQKKADKIKPVPKFPATSRDITLIVDNSIEAAGIISVVEKNRNDLIEEIQIIDIYQGENITKGKKSISLRITYRSDSATLEDEIVNNLNKSIGTNLQKEFKADFPS